MSSTTCKNCGGDEAIHHYKTGQCPVGGREAAVGRNQEWKSTTFKPVKDALIKMQERAAQLQAERDAAIDSAEYYKHTFLGMQTSIDNLSAELATVKAERDALQSDIDILRNELDKHEPIEWPGLTGFTP